MIMCFRRESVALPPAQPSKCDTKYYVPEWPAINEPSVFVCALSENECGELAVVIGRVSILSYTWVIRLIVCVGLVHEEAL